MMHLLFSQRYMGVGKKIFKICTIFIVSPQNLKLGSGHELSFPSPFILHTEFRIDNPSSFRENAIKVQMLTHYNEQKIIQRCMILKCLLHFMVHAR